MKVRQFRFLVKQAPHRGMADQGANIERALEQTDKMQSVGLVKLVRGDIR